MQIKMKNFAHTELSKTGTSEQFQDRLQASADKKERMARENLDKIRYEDMDPPQSQQRNTRLPNQALLLLQSLLEKRVVDVCANCHAVTATVR